MPRYKNNSNTYDLPISYVQNDGLLLTKYIEKEGGTVDIEYYIPESLRHTLISIDDMDVLPVPSPVINTKAESITVQETFIDYTPDDETLTVNRQEMLIQNDTQDLVYVWINHSFDETDPVEVQQQIEKQIPVLSGNSITVTVPSYSFLVRLEQLDLGTVYVTSTIIF